LTRLHQRADGDLQIAVGELLASNLARIATRDGHVLLNRVAVPVARR
jgi:hypothetical protein